MGTTRSYRQACHIARGLDVIGERWTLLIVRELLLGPRRYGQLAENLEGMGANLLAARLKELEAKGLIEKIDDPAGSKRKRYQLTENGRGLEPVLSEIMRWATNLPASEHDETDQIYRDEWDGLALRLLYRPERGSHVEGVVHLAADGALASVEIGAEGIRLSEPTDIQPDATLSGDRDAIVQLVTGRETLNKLQKSGALKVSGNRTFARAFAAGFLRKT